MYHFRSERKVSEIFLLRLFSTACGGAGAIHHRGCCLGHICCSQSNLFFAAVCAFVGGDGCIVFAIYI